MRKIICAALALGVVAFAVHGAGAQTAQSTPTPVEAFGRLPAANSAAISPDGSKVVLAAAIQGPLEITVIDLNSKTVTYRRGLDEQTQLRGVGWADDHRVSLVVSRTAGSNDLQFEGGERRLDIFRSGVLDLTNSQVTLLTPEGFLSWATMGSRLIAPISGEPDSGRMLAPTVGNDVMLGLYRVNFATGRVFGAQPRGVTTHTVNFVLDANGAVAARTDEDDTSNHWSIAAYTGDTPHPLLDGVSTTGDAPYIGGLLADGRFAMLDHDAKDDFVVAYAVDRSTGAREIIFQRPNVDIADFVRDPWTHQPVGVSWIENEGKQHFFDPALQAVYERLTALPDAGGVRIEFWSRDKNRTLIFLDRTLDGGGYFVFTPASNELMPLFARYPELEHVSLGDRQSITYPARDGTRIPAYLTLPPHADPHNLPLVVLVHGGPHGVRDTMDFDFWSSFLASRGYAVLQPNYRGSGGYGAHWERAGYHQWGSGVMQTDVEDGAVALAHAGIADARRICIVGASYGGYAALAGATLTPDRYRCAASVAGLSDLVDALVTGHIRTGSRSKSSDFWRQSIGDVNTDRDALRAISPINLVDRVHIPILLMHGTDDTVVPITQSRRMYDRLRGAGKDARFVELRGDDHWLSDAGTRIQMLRELDTFLAANIGPNAPLTH